MAAVCDQMVCVCVCVQARKNREIALLQRKIDEVPSRTELSQYQHRFIELYNQGQSVCYKTTIILSIRLLGRTQSVLCAPFLTVIPISRAVAATLTETRQFYTLYNTLEDQKAYMEKEVCATCCLILTTSLLDYDNIVLLDSITVGWNTQQYPRQLRHVSVVLALIRTEGRG